MRHSKRTKLINEDVMNALKLRNIKVIYFINYIVNIWTFRTRSK